MNADMEEGNQNNYGHGIGPTKEEDQEKMMLNMWI